MVYVFLVEEGEAHFAIEDGGVGDGDVYVVMGFELFGGLAYGDVVEDEEALLPVEGGEVFGVGAFGVVGVFMDRKLLVGSEYFGCVGVGDTLIAIVFVGGCGRRLGMVRLLGGGYFYFATFYGNDYGVGFGIGLDVKGGAEDGGGNVTGAHDEGAGGIVGDVEVGFAGQRYFADGVAKVGLVTEGAVVIECDPTAVG